MYKVTNSFKSSATLVTILGISIFLAFSITFLLFGQLNSDEGWYLYASKLVYEGKLPYQDFAYSQTPLLPYIYGLPQAIFSPSIFLGRITSITFSVATLALCISLARKLGGRASGAITAVLLATFTYGIYFNTVVKTYSLISFLFTLTLYLLSSTTLEEQYKYPLATLSAILATLVRLSALPFALVILVYTLLTARYKATRVAICLSSTCLACLALFFFMPNLAATKWNLFDCHLANWDNPSTLEKLETILFLRVPTILVVLAPYILLALAVVLANRNREQTIPNPKFKSPILAVSSGLFLFSFSHLVNGNWYVEYLVPAFFPLLPILGAKFADSIQQQAKNLVLPAVFVATILLSIFSPLHSGLKHALVSNQRPVPLQTENIASFITNATSSSDELFALQALWATIESGRAMLPGLSMAQFSYHDMPTPYAQTLKVVNYEIIYDYIVKEQAAVVVLTDFDWQMLDSIHKAEDFGIALQNRYHLQFVNFVDMTIGNIYIFSSNRNTD